MMNLNQKERISKSLQRLFNHPLWDEPDGEIDSVLLSARKQDDYLIERDSQKWTF
jgi:ABC-type cobalt transport system substrate-binding protein